MLLHNAAVMFAQQPGGNDNSKIVALVIAGIAALIFLLFLFVFFSFVRLWIQSLLTGANISIFSLIGMKLRKVDYAIIVEQKIALVQAGVRITTEELESHYLAGGNVRKTATAVIAAHKAKVELPWSTAAAIDLANRWDEFVLEDLK